MSFVNSASTSVEPLPSEHATASNFYIDTSEKSKLCHVIERKEGHLGKGDEHVQRFTIFEEGHFVLHVKNLGLMPIPNLSFGVSVFCYSQRPRSGSSDSLVVLPGEKARKPLSKASALRAIHKSRTESVLANQFWQTNFGVFEDGSKSSGNSEHGSVLPVIVEVKLESNTMLGIKDVYYEVLLCSEYEKVFAYDGIITGKDKQIINSCVGKGLYKIFIDNCSPVNGQNINVNIVSEAYSKDQRNVSKGQMIATPTFSVFGKMAPMTLNLEVEFNPLFRYTKQAHFKYNIVRIIDSEVEMTMFEELLKFAENLSAKVECGYPDEILESIEAAKQNKTLVMLNGFKQKLMPASFTQENIESVIAKGLQVVAKREELMDDFLDLFKETRNQEIAFLQAGARDVGTVQQLYNVLETRVIKIRESLDNDEKKLGSKLSQLLAEAATFLDRVRKQDAFRMKIRRFIEKELTPASKPELNELKKELDDIFLIPIPATPLHKRSAAKAAFDLDDEDDSVHASALLKQEGDVFKERLASMMNKITTMEEILQSLESVLQSAEQSAPLGTFLHMHKETVQHLPEYEKAMAAYSSLLKKEEAEARRQAKLRKEEEERKRKQLEEEKKKQEEQRKAEEAEKAKKQKEEEEARVHQEKLKKEQEEQKKAAEKLQQQKQQQQIPAPAPSPAPAVVIEPESLASTTEESPIAVQKPRKKSRKGSQKKTEAPEDDMPPIEIVETPMSSTTSPTSTLSSTTAESPNSTTIGVSPVAKGENLFKEMHSNVLALMQILYKSEAALSEKGKLMVFNEHPFADHIMVIVHCWVALLMQHKTKATVFFTSKDRPCWEILRKVNKNAEAFVKKFLTLPSVVQLPNDQNKEFNTTVLLIQYGLHTDGILIDIVRELLSAKQATLLNASYTPESLLRNTKIRDELLATLDFFNQMQFDFGDFFVSNAVNTKSKNAFITPEATSAVPLRSLVQTPRTPSTPQQESSTSSSSSISPSTSTENLSESSSSSPKTSIISEEHTAFLSKVAAEVKTIVNYFVKQKESKAQLREVGNELTNPEITTLVRSNLLEQTIMPALKDGLLDQTSFWKALSLCSQSDEVFTKIAASLSKAYAQSSDDEKATIFIVLCINCKKFADLVRLLAMDQHTLESFYAPNSLVRDRQASAKLHKYISSLSKLPIQLRN